MKYCNRLKKARERHWYKVDRPTMKGVIKWVNVYGFDNIKRQLQNYPSTGRFFYTHTDKVVYFEKKEDAVYFALKWS